jgi:hypothetical protein
MATYSIKKPARAAVDVVADDNVRVLLKAFEKGRGGRHTGSKSKGGRTIFEIGDASLECHACRILAARIFKALMDAPDWTAHRSTSRRSAS